ncbi:MAG: glutamine--tRNA ligase/YqeY domain fusion protein [Spirochaetes bacterium]|nr:MAG: glutamine--tRNA ligase/YqeY domain fusion protein [Spirochaetota bacterium]
MEMESSPRSLNFIEEIIEEDLRTGKNGDTVLTRFPPEPNGYLHIGHAKSICLNFGLAKRYTGKCNLRFDDTNPDKEDVEYVDSIKEDVEWLGFKWNAEPFYASDYFGQLYEWAVMLIKKGKAFVCDMSAEEIAATRGTPTQPGAESPGRKRSVEENLELFERMKRGEFPDGAKVLRARIDMASPNMHMRDPVMYRLKRAEHHRTGSEWCIYPMYDYAHGQSDYIEGITHSICTLEFEVHRPLYDWFLDQIAEPGKIRPRQIEFARLNLTYTVMSKRMLLRLVKEGFVKGWDDPRMPTIAGMRRRGYTPESLRAFAATIGVAKRDTVVDMALLEHCVRDDLNKKARRVMGVVNPLKVIIENYPEGKTEEFEVKNNPEDESMGTRKVPFSRTLYIEREDFMENPVKGFFRLSPGKEVRLRAAYLVTCTGVIKDEKGGVAEIRCTCDPASRGGDAPDGRKVKGTLHWVSAPTAVESEIRLYDRLFTKEDPATTQEGVDFTTNLNPDSMKTVTGLVEPSVKEYGPGAIFQFERLGYFSMDPDSTKERPVFNRTVSLKDSWTKSAQGAK